MSSPKAGASAGMTIGILGGGQLGRMLAIAAARLGFHCHVYSSEPDSCAFEVARRTSCAGYDDWKELAAFASAVDVVTYEFENVPAETARILGEHAPVRPGALALATAQDRSVEKSFLASHAIPTAPFADVDDEARFRQAHLHQWQQALPAGENFDVVSMSGKKFNRVVQRARRVVFKSTGNHG